MRTSIDPMMLPAVGTEVDPGWPWLLALRDQLLQAGAQPWLLLHGNWQSEAWRIWLHLQPETDLPAEEGEAVFAWENDLSLRPNPAAARLPFATLWAHYLPYCLLGLKARQLGRTVAISHFAQTLDGKIATHSGHSRWIGNDANLIHAHRMRALCDGILIGRGTLCQDQPSLTVRLVEGRNPQRIVLASSDCDFASLQESSHEPIWWIGYQGDRQPPEGVYCVELPGGSVPQSSQEVLQTLYHAGLNTVYIEGGAQTTSRFLEEGMIDVVQLHISPLLFGSGKAGMALSSIDMVDDCIQFEPAYFLPAGDAVMFVGQPLTNTHDADAG